MTSAEQPSAAFRPAVLLGGSPSPRAAHLPFASDLIAALKPSLIVELGVGFGDTYFGFCQLITDYRLKCECYGVDRWDAVEAAHGSVYDAVSRHNAAKYKSFSHLMRKSPGDALAQFSNDSIDLLSVDGMRPYDELTQLFDAWLPKLKSSGVVLLSGISLSLEAGAAKVWDDLQRLHPHFSFRNNNGMGVLSKSPDAESLPFLATLFRSSAAQQDRIRRYYFLCGERLELAARLGASGASDPGCSLFQLFRSQSGEYATSAELSHVIGTGSWVNLQLDLPNGCGDRPLRLAVANRPAVVDIATLSLRKNDGSVVWTWNPKDVTDTLEMNGTAVRMPSSEFCRVLAYGNSPHVLLPEFRGSAFEQPLTLAIRLRVDLELAAVREMNQKWADLEKAKSEFEARKLTEDEASSPAKLESAMAKARSESAKHLAQARIEHEAKFKQITADAEARLEAMRLEFEQQLVQANGQLEDERRLHKSTLMEKEQLAAQHPRMLQEISIAQGNVEELKAEIERLSTEMATMEYDLAEMRKLNGRLTAALEEERLVRASMQDSSSWQLTKPLRAVGDLFGPRKKY